MKLIIVFTILSIANVIGSTIRSIVTIKATKGIASIVNAAYFAFYNIVMIYTVADFPLLTKCIITFVCNLIGVFIVKYFEEKSRKEKLWKVECTLSKEDFEENKTILENFKVPHNYIDIEKWVLVNFYCSTSKQSEIVKNLLCEMNAKYFVSESKTL